MKWLKEGIEAILDLNILSMLNWEEIEKRACGGDIEVDILKSITEYRNENEESQVIKWFWQMFEEFTQEERKMYLKFVWGRSKIPQDTTNLAYRHCISLYSHWNDKSLPKSHTCFFTIDIPEYKEFDVMNARIKLAIETCGEIDDDFRNNRDEDQDAAGGNDYY